MEMEKEFTKVVNPKDIAEICAGLGHPYKAKVLFVLRELKKASLMHVIRECAREKGYYRQFTAAKGHIEKMALHGVVDLRRDDNGEYTVELKKDVEIYIKEL